jgi:site-specific DNA-methyltransferase (adenine-specific)
MTSTLYSGDNLDVLRRYITDKSVNLLYLDPPFNSNATYNVLFAEQNWSGRRRSRRLSIRSDGQIGRY